MPAWKRPASGQQGGIFCVATRLYYPLGIGQAHLDPELYAAAAPP
ncbi:hypothetical protein JCM15764A_01660 [Geotalea toluenoxydans]